MAFFQQPPELGNTYLADDPLREHLLRVLPADVLAELDPQLHELGEAAAGELLGLGARAEREPPRHIPYDAWGRRVDRIEVSQAWRDLHAWQVHLGLCALPYEDDLGADARVVQHALKHLYAPSSATYTCPVAMTDAAARVLVEHADPAVRDRVVPRLTARDVAEAWTSGQWMTEREGGSDVGSTATTAQRDGDGVWRLYGTKWFTSATTADCALTLARPEGAGSGSRALGLFLVELADPETGAPRMGETILVNRLKDKLGTRALPTAELTLAGVPVTPVGAPEHGLRRISGMLNITRAHNAVGASAGMRRAVQWARAYAEVREAFGQRLIDLPLHRETLADLAVDAEGAFILTARVMQLLGRSEQGMAAAAEQQALRALLPVAKLLTAKDAVAVASEAIEALGGAGYIEDTGFPRLLRDAQVLPIWEGTTNVLSLDLLRAAAKEDAVIALLSDLADRLAAASEPGLSDVVASVTAEADALGAQARTWEESDRAVIEAGMRSYALRLGRCYTAALLCEHAAHRLAKYHDGRAAAAARRYARRWLRGAAASPGAEQLSETAALLDQGVS